MARRRKPTLPTEGDSDQARRDQEVLRANKELAAFFKGQRTEREARAALKTIKAFVRHRERLDPGHRPPLPNASTTPGTTHSTSRKVADSAGVRPRKKGRKPTPVEPQVETKHQHAPDSDKRLSDGSES